MQKILINNQYNIDRNRFTYAKLTLQDQKKLSKETRAVLVSK